MQFGRRMAIAAGTTCYTLNILIVCEEFKHHISTRVHIVRHACEAGVVSGRPVDERVVHERLEQGEQRLTAGPQRGEHVLTAEPERSWPGAGRGVRTGSCSGATIAAWNDKKVSDCTLGRRQNQMMTAIPLAGPSTVMCYLPIAEWNTDSV